MVNIDSIKSGKELLNVDLEDESLYLGRKSVLVGQQWAQLFKESQLFTWFSLNQILIRFS